MNEFNAIIGTVGFPCAACIAMGMFCNGLVKTMTGQFNDLMMKVTSTMSENTAAMNNLCAEIRERGETK